MEFHRARLNSLTSVEAIGGARAGAFAVAVVYYKPCMQSSSLDKPHTTTAQVVDTVLSSARTVASAAPYLAGLLAPLSKYVRVPAAGLPPSVARGTVASVEKRYGFWVHPTTTRQQQQQQRYRWVLYIHGGGYALANPGTHVEVLHMLAYVLQCSVFAPYYTHKPVDQIHTTLVASYVHALQCQDGVLPQSFLGDSAGGGLCVTLYQHLQEHTHHPVPFSLVLFSPWVLLDTEHPHFYDDTYAGVDFLPKPLLQAYAVRARALSAHEVMPRMSFPPTLVVYGGQEVLGKGIEHCFHGVGNTRLVRYDGMRHIFPVVHGARDYTAFDALQRAARFVRTDRRYVCSPALRVVWGDGGTGRLQVRWFLQGVDDVSAWFTSVPGPDRVHTWPVYARAYWSMDAGTTATAAMAAAVLTFEVRAQASRRTLRHGRLPACTLDDYATVVELRI